MVTELTKEQADEIYANWDSYPSCKVSINFGGGGESPWGKELPNGLIGLDNWPFMYNCYRWQDIVASKSLTDPKAENFGIIHRRWNAKLWYKYGPNEDEAEDRKIREALLDKLQHLGTVGFWVAGVGYVAFEQEEGAEDKLLAALSEFSDINAALYTEDEESEG